MSYVTYETVEDLITSLYSHPTTKPLANVSEGECVGYVHIVSPYWVKGKYQIMHVFTTYKFFKVPPVLSVLNTIEQRLISKQYNIVLPLSQRALAGLVYESEGCNADQLMNLVLY